MDKLVYLYCCMHQGCHKQYNSKFNLKRHVETVHFRIRKHECMTCHNKFASKQNLREHEYVHTGAKPFSCPFCNQSFRQASQLSLHKRVHLLKGPQAEAISKLHDASESRSLDSNSDDIIDLN
mmetsp:Transcript_19940/g.36874  ORF Transcript_19940/g.36874 Transcript_19940/m.36874 type:complete len:123 (+) Transcript_19940:2962-3330(+)